MPLEPSPTLLKKMKVGSGPVNTQGPANPSFLRDFLEGLVDTGLGAIGVGPDTKANRVGALLGMALPIGKKLGRFDDVKLKDTDFPSQNRLAMGMTPSTGEYDQAGRYVGQAAKPKVDDVFETHVASSVGKHDPRVKIQSTEESFVNRGEAKGLSPSDEQYERMMRKLRK